jgi:hypothetical protein
MSKHHHVVRIDIEPDDENPYRSRTHGWQVRVSFHGERRTKFFADQKYGGREEALRLAVEHRDRLLEEREAMRAGGPSERRAQARSTSGVAGIRLTYKNATAYIEANWVDDDGRSVSCFSVERWGLRKAVWKACKARSMGRGVRNPEHVQQMFDRALPNLQSALEARVSQSPGGDGTASASTPVMGEDQGQQH